MSSSTKMSTSGVDGNMALRVDASMPVTFLPYFKYSRYCKATHEADTMT